MKFVYLGIVVVIFQYVKCQEYRASLIGQDYILRSCVSSVELIRNHRKTGKDDKIISTNNVAESSEIREIFAPSKGLMGISGKVKKRKIEETPLRTVNIRRAGKVQSPLPFVRKDSFPELPQIQNYQQKRQRGSEVIVIKPKS